MKQIHFSRKCRQLKHLAERYQMELNNAESLNSPRLLRLLQKIKVLWAELRRVFSALYLRRLLGSAGAIAGIVYGQSASAQSFAAPVTNPFVMQINEGAEVVPAYADFDGDGDLDVMWGSYYGDFNYFENIGTAEAPQFAAGVLNPFGLASVDDFLIPAAVDLDNDGDYDLLVTRYYSEVFYYENIGTATNPIFASPVLNPFGLQIDDQMGFVPYIADFDGDGDFDILALGEYNETFYFENTGTAEAPAFANPVTDPYNLEFGEEFTFLMLGDLDMDGDLDILAMDYYGIFKYFENIGTPALAVFGEPVSDPFGLSLEDVEIYGQPALVDLDGDGDLDIVLNDYYGNIIYIENTTTSLSEVNVDISDLKLYPNPSTDILNISTDAEIKNVEILDLNGRLVAAYGRERSISLKAFENGFYLLRLETEAGSVVRKIQVVK